ncbi:uncharacterized protein BDZ99DRAFT_543920 [Mytilinidion resinicola]|uniref:Uncharacterized protein n=1 Tax=Mytilinidion resinicola TaxID=574789 RepID=A0A6A6Y8R0_9PEZI|nr:uncharacterized protein BDZ99DRAFT_543920 [Mytilinidion resinicola]KAF2804938.1 hypothetical protein BDZ99DRAFT_543920 [Mytilinidion resinicola]
METGSNVVFGIEANAHPALKGNVHSALFNSGSSQSLAEPHYICTSGNFTWNATASIGMCSSCTDTTALVKKTHNLDTGDWILSLPSLYSPSDPFNITYQSYAGSPIDGQMLRIQTLVDGSDPGPIIILSMYLNVDPKQIDTGNNSYRDLNAITYTSPTALSPRPSSPTNPPSNAPPPPPPQAPPTPKKSSRPGSSAPASPATSPSPRPPNAAAATRMSTSSPLTPFPQLKHLGMGPLAPRLRPLFPRIPRPRQPPQPGLQRLLPPIRHPLLPRQHAIPLPRLLVRQLQQLGLCGSRGRAWIVRWSWWRRRMRNRMREAAGAGDGTLGARGEAWERVVHVRFGAGAVFGGGWGHWEGGGGGEGGRFGEGRWDEGYVRVRRGGARLAKG